MKPEDFNRTRRILFSTFTQGIKGQIDQDKAFEYLESYHQSGSIDAPSYAGLFAELSFYKAYKKEFNLTVAADIGDHADFAGTMSKNPFRFDVTTNPDYKKLSDYEPLQKAEDAKYKIAIMSRNGVLEELIDINFEFCPECHQGRLIDMVVLLPENLNDKGECLWNNDQVLIGICNHCDYYVERDRIVTPYLSEYKVEIANKLEHIGDEIDKSSMQKTMVIGTVKERHSDLILPYLHRRFDKSIMAVSEREYYVFDRREGDGYHQLKVYYKKNLRLLDEYIHDTYPIDFS